MAQSYTRAPDGTLTDVYMRPNYTPIRAQLLQFSKTHFDEAIHSVIPGTPSQTTASVQDISGKSETQIWQVFKQAQYNAKAGNHRHVTVPITGGDPTVFYQLVLILLRLRWEYDTEGKDGLPEFQLMTTDARCNRINSWLKALTPVLDQHEKVHMAQLIALRRLFKAQSPVFP